MPSEPTEEAPSRPGPFAERPAVHVDGVTKRFGAGAQAVTALDDVSLAIGDNEFFTLLGPSGCGKTTLLRIVAGFEAVSAGAVYLFGDEIEQLPPHLRPINTVFQHYALFPHMTVEQNIAFGLERLRKPRTEVRARVAQMLSLVQLERFATRRPDQLSGGQAQRVALARALAPHPKVLLLDEPLSALDLKLRQTMRQELKELQRDTGITFVFVTHDQEEALAMSDRVAVMSEGRVQQIGTPAEVYERPHNRFVADFIGDTNLIDVTVVSDVRDGTLRCETSGGLEILCQCETANRPPPGQTAHVSIRPEKLSLVRRGEDGAGVLACVVDQLTYLGTDTQVRVRLEDGLALTVRVQNAHDTDLHAPGATSGLRLDAGAARLLAD